MGSELELQDRGASREKRGREDSGPGQQGHTDMQKWKSSLSACE